MKPRLSLHKYARQLSKAVHGEPSRAAPPRRAEGRQRSFLSNFRQTHISQSRLLKGVVLYRKGGEKAVVNMYLLRLFAPLSSEFRLCRTFEALRLPSNPKPQASDWTAM